MIVILSDLLHSRVVSAVPRGHITDTLLTETKCGPNKNRCSRTVRRECCAFLTCASRIVNLPTFLDADGRNLKPLLPHSDLDYKRVALERWGGRFTSTCVSVGISGLSQ